ncbi:MAG: type II/IV secretion system protein [Nitrospirae bacterium]|nr:type II/IV secretion system protein [Nitrospirota bacterium]MBF0540285.1 type II/IV secretion system protein [Nitrospirota bacterium]
MTKRKKLYDILAKKGLLNEAKNAISTAQQKITGELIGKTLLDLGFVSAVEVAEALAEQADLPFVDLNNYKINVEAIKRVPIDLADKNGFIPLDIQDSRLTIGVINPYNISAMDSVTKLIGHSPKICVVDSASYYDVLDKVYSFLETPLPKQVEDIIAKLSQSKLLETDSISLLTELLIKDGIRNGTTDIHITPFEQAIHIFYRIDGVLVHGYCVPKIAQSGIISRIKVMSSIDIAENRLPQDGYFKFSFLKKNYDMRVSTTPTIYGEKVVIRVLSGSVGMLLNIAQLGFDEHDIKKLQLLFNKPNGIILITGPTGSGKTTTLYSALREVNLLEKNVITVEDPVEYRLSLVTQTQINLKAGYDFALAGKYFMRQDPDVILLGEIRDENTATIAVRASITGHLVLSTLHTNDAISSVPRLLDLNIDKFLLATSLIGVIAQRLVRKLCTFCKEKQVLTDEQRQYFVSLKYSEEKINEINEKIFTANGCSQCNKTGYHGRTVIGEILIIDDEMKELISEGASIMNMKTTAKKQGLKTIRDNALDKVLMGITDIREMIRVVG